MYIMRHYSELCISAMRKAKKFWLVALCVSVLSLQLLGQNAPKGTTYTVKKGDTLYRLSVKFGVSVDVLKLANPHIIGNNISVDEVLKIPAKPKSTVDVAVKLDQPLVLTDELDLSANIALPLIAVADADEKAVDSATEKATVNTTENLTDSATERATASASEKTLDNATEKGVKLTAAPKDSLSLVPVKHTVEKGETLFAISRKHDQNIKAIIKWNGLVNANISVGQSLIVKWTNGANEVLSDEELKKVNLHVPPPPPVVLTKYQRKYLHFSNDKNKRYKAKKQVGNAIWFDDSSEVNGEANMYALHKTAPIYSIVKVVNPINQHEVYVKVIGRLPNNISNNDVVISLALSAAKKLNVFDYKTLVESEYYVRK